MAAMGTRALALCLLLLVAGVHKAACRELKQDDLVSQEEAPLEGLGPVPAPAPAPGPDGGLYGFEQGEEQASSLGGTTETEDYAPEEDSSTGATEEDAGAVAGGSDNTPDAGGEPVEDGDLTIQNGNTLLTTNDVPPAEGFTPPEVPAEFRGSCQLTPQQYNQCDDGMNLFPGTADQYQKLGDPSQVENCGLIPVSSVVQSIEDWAYRGQYGGCPIRAVTATRICIGQGPADGSWRARVLLWPEGDCKPLCVKMTGSGSSVENFGRTASC